jgi:hypothetical protein
MKTQETLYYNTKIFATLSFTDLRGVSSIKEDKAEISTGVVPSSSRISILRLIFF